MLVSHGYRARPNDNLIKTTDPSYTFFVEHHGVLDLIGVIVNGSLVNFDMRVPINESSDIQRIEHWLRKAADAVIEVRI